MISAQNAMELSINGFIDTFDDLVTNANSQGLFYVELSNYLPPTILDLLTDRGYTIKEEQDSITISWHSPTTLLEIE